MIRLLAPAVARRRARQPIKKEKAQSKSDEPESQSSGNGRNTDDEHKTGNLPAERPSMIERPDLLNHGEQKGGR
jgi:hypothetical protein